MANTKISQLTANTNPNGGEELVYAYNNTNGKMSLNTMKTFVENNLSGYATTADLAGKQDTLVSGTNIKTINNSSLLGSGNLDISGGVAYTAGTGIDITGGVISATGGGGGGVTELTADANIWELSEGNYITTHQLYYKTGEHLNHEGNGQNRKTYIIVTVNSNNERGFFYFDNDDSGGYSRGACGYGCSTSGTSGLLYILYNYDWYMNFHNFTGSAGVLTKNSFNTTWNTASGTVQLNCTTGCYTGMNYSAIIPTQANSYTLTVDGVTVTNPFNVTLPTNTTKHAIVFLKAVSNTVLEVVDCKIAA